MKIRKNISLYWLLATCILVIVSSCASIDLYEKSAAIPGHSWQNSFQPSFNFEIKDTASAYKLYLILRHNDKYNFNNIYINLHAKQPGVDSTQKVKFDLPLGTNEDGWLGSGMDDIYEHRIALTTAGQSFFFKKKGEYSFRVEQIMRENPLKNVLDIGLRIEKVQ